jgi:hypothetical protein
MTLIDKRSLSPSPQNIQKARFALAQVTPEMLTAAGLTLDASDATAAFAREFEWVDQTLLRTLYTPLQSEELVTYFPAGGPSVESVTWRQVTELGVAEVGGDYTTRAPRADVVGSEKTVKVENITAEWAVSVFDLVRAASNPTINLSAEKKEAAFNMVRRSHDQICLSGHTALARTGLVNDAAVPVVTAVTGTAWATATADEMVDDVDKLTWAIVTNTKNNVVPDTLVVPLSLGSRLSKRIGTDANQTVGSWIVSKSQHVKKIILTPALDTADAGGDGPRIMAYKNDKSVLRYGANAMFTELAPQNRGFEIVTPCYGRTSFLQVLVPLACAYMDVD